MAVGFLGNKITDRPREAIPIPSRVESVRPSVKYVDEFLFDLILYVNNLSVIKGAGLPGLNQC